MFRNNFVATIFFFMTGMVFVYENTCKTYEIQDDLNNSINMYVSMK